MMETSEGDLTSGATYSVNTIDEQSNFVLQSKPNSLIKVIFEKYDHTKDNKCFFVVIACFLCKNEKLIIFLCVKANSNNISRLNNKRVYSYNSNTRNMKEMSTIAAIF